MEDDLPRNLDAIADAAIVAHMQTRSILILEAAIKSVLDAYDLPAAVQILREHAQQLEDHG